MRDLRRRAARAALLPHLKTAGVAPAHLMKVLRKECERAGCEEPLVDYDPPTLAITIPGWRGDLKSFERFVTKDGGLDDAIREATDGDGWVLDYSSPKLSVKDGAASISISLHEYDPEEDGAF